LLRTYTIFKLVLKDPQLKKSLKLKEIYADLSNANAAHKKREFISL
jgi:hypothetical protein